MYYEPSFSTFLCLCSSNIFGGIYFGTIFFISHFYDGTSHFNDKIDASTGDKKPMDVDWATAQVEGASNYGGEFWAQMNGGLNFQIEHHLFPRVCSVHYTTIAPLVREWCLKRNIKYTHHKTMFDSIYSTFIYLRKMGIKPKNISDKKTL